MEPGSAREQVGRSTASLAAPSSSSCPFRRRHRRQPGQSRTRLRQHGAATDHLPHRGRCLRSSSAPCSSRGDCSASPDVYIFVWLRVLRRRPRHGRTSSWRTLATAQDEPGRSGPLPSGRVRVHPRLAPLAVAAFLIGTFFAHGRRLLALQTLHTKPGPFPENGMVPLLSPL